MRIAVATLADAANVRENMLSILSGGVTGVRNAEYPTALSVDLALMIELGESDLSQDDSSQVDIKIVDEAEGLIANFGGKLGWAASEVWPQYVPAVIALKGVDLPAPGRYDVRVKIGSLDEISLRVNADAVSE